MKRSAYAACSAALTVLKLLQDPESMLARMFQGDIGKRKDDKVNHWLRARLLTSPCHQPNTYKVTEAAATCSWKLNGRCSECAGENIH